MDIEPSKYTVKLNDVDSNGSKTFIGSGTLLINDENAYLITCLHVTDKKHNIEAMFSNEKTTKLSMDDCVSFSAEEDYCCFRLIKTEWMFQLPDQTVRTPKSNMNLTAHGFPQRIVGNANDFREKSSIRCHTTNILNDNTMFYCRFEENILDGGMDEWLHGYSGGGMYSDDGSLVGILKGRDETRGTDDRELEFCAITISRILESLESYRDINAEWISHGLVRRISSSEDKSRNFLPNSVNVLNLWSLMLVLKKPVVLILLNRSPAVREVLKNTDWLNEFNPAYPWHSGTQLSENAAIIRNYTIPLNNNAALTINEFIRSWRSMGLKTPLLIHLDLTEADSIPSIENLYRFAKGLVQKDSYIFASENFFTKFYSKDIFINTQSLCDEPLNLFQDIEIMNGLIPAYDRLILIIQRHSFEMDEVLYQINNLFDKNDLTHKIDYIRIAILYARITGDCQFLSHIKELLPFIPEPDKLFYLSVCSEEDEDTDDAEISDIMQLKNGIEQQEWGDLHQLLSEHDESYWYIFSELIGKKSENCFAAFMRELLQDVEIHLLYQYLMLCNRWGFAWLCRLKPYIRENVLYLLPSDHNETCDPIERDNAARLWKLIYDRNK